MCSELLIREVCGRHPNEVPVLPHLGLLGEEACLYQFHKSYPPLAMFLLTFVTSGRRRFAGGGGECDAVLGLFKSEE